MFIPPYSVHCLCVCVCAISVNKFSIRNRWIIPRSQLYNSVSWGNFQLQHSQNAMQCNGIAKVMLFIFKSSNVIVMKTSANFVLCYNCVVILFKGKSIFEHQHKIYLSDVKCTKMHLWLWALFGMQPPITIIIGETNQKKRCRSFTHRTHWSGDIYSFERKAD